MLHIFQFTDYFATKLCSFSSHDLDLRFNFIFVNVIWFCFAWILWLDKKFWCSLERWINFIVTLYVTHSRLSETQKLDIKLIKTCSNSRTRRQIFSFESFCIRWHLFLLQPAKYISKSKISVTRDYFNCYLATPLETRNIINYLLHLASFLDQTNNWQKNEKWTFTWNPKPGFQISFLQWCR